MPHARTRLIRLGAVALASVATLGAMTGRAGAATPGSSGNSGASAVPATLSGIKAEAAADIANRVNDLNAAIAKVNGAEGLGAGQDTVVSYLGADIAPLQQLNQTMQGDGTPQQAAHDFGTIFTGYRIYRLVLPAARIAADADHATTSAIPNLTADADQRHQRVGRHGAGRYAGAVERRQRATERAQILRSDGHRRTPEGPGRPQADCAGPQSRSRGGHNLDHGDDELRTVSAFNCGRLRAALLDCARSRRMPRR
jgi:hypothetical protein